MLLADLQAGLLDPAVAAGIGWRVRQALEADLITLRPAANGRHVVAEFELAPVQLAVGAVPGSAVARSGFGTFRQRVEIG